MTTTQDHTTTTTRLPVWARLAGGMQKPLLPGTTVQDAIRFTGLADWDVQTMPLVTMGHDGMPLNTEKVATVRRTPDGGSSVLGVGLGKDYPVIPNEVALGMDALLSESGAEVDYAGGWLGGKRTFLSMRLPQTITIGGSDRTDLNLTALTSHDGSLALTLLVTPVRFACTNALAVSFREAVASYRVRHVGDAGLKIAEARAALNMAFAYGDRWEQAMEALLAESMTTREFNGMVEAQFLPMKDDAKPATRDRVLTARADLSALFASADTQEFGRGTKYGAFNALTEWAEWVRPRNTASERQAASVVMGAGAVFRDRAFRTVAAA